MRLWPRTLAGRLALLLLATLFVAQLITFALFTGERVSSFRNSFRQEFFARFVSLVELVEDSPADLRGRVLRTARFPGFRGTVGSTPLVTTDPADAAELRTTLAAALGKPETDIHVDLDPPQPAARPELLGDAEDGSPPPPRRGRHRSAHWWPRKPPTVWINVAVRLADGAWFNATAARPPVPPLGGAFLASFLISAVAVAAAGAIGIGYASRPLRRLATAADRLGRGESFAPLPETGPDETRHANAAFNRMRKRLDRYIRDRTAMLAAIAHDLRTPITSLRLRAEFIEDEEAKAKILETLAEMQAMAEAVLAFARGDAESEETRATDIAALVESIVDDVAESGRDATFADSPPVVRRCRPFALRRAIANLIDNATFYGGRARARVETGKDEVRIIVDDDGPGVPASDLERVFDPFVRLEGSRSRETGGAGLGLAISRGILRAHGGDVTLQNRPGGGLRAIATLPA